MSFAGTPLGQGRRLDHHTFLGKPPSNNGNRPPSPHRIPPSSYAYGAPALGSRSPPKPTSPPRERNTTTLDHGDDDSALTRFAKLKQQQSLSHLPGAPKIITSPPHNEKWSVKDTSVLIASAFSQAASGVEVMQTNPHNYTWASGSRTTTTVPRSTSVDYEQQSTSTSTRRLAPPPSRNAPPSKTNANARPKPLSKKSSSSLKIVPDSEGEESQSMSMDRSARGTSPFDSLRDLAQRTYQKASYYVRERSREPESMNENGSYDYAAEESAYQNEIAESASAKRNSMAIHKKNRMSMDKMAYKPSRESEDEDDDEVSDDGKKRRRKSKKKEAHGGPLSSLPMVGAEKKRRRKKGVKGAAGGEEGDEKEAEVEEED